MKLASLFALLCVSTCLGCHTTAEDFNFQIRNDAGRKLAAYPVVTNPPPPHREHDPQGDVLPGQARDLYNPGGFNPVYSFQLFDLPTTQPTGIHIGLALEDDPPVVLVQVFHYKTDPGSEGTDPNMQPIKLDEHLFELEPGEWEILVPEDYAVQMTKL